MIMLNAVVLIIANQHDLKSNSDLSNVLVTNLMVDLL